MAETDRLEEIEEIEDRVAKIGRPTPWWEPDLRWLIAQVRELEAAKEKLSILNRHFDAGWDRMQGHVALAEEETERLRDHVRELEADKQRLDWMDANSVGLSWSATIPPCPPSGRAAIDEAMAATADLLDEKRQQRFRE